MGTVTNPMGSLLNGLVTGYGLAHQIKQQAMQEEAHQRNMADMDREAQVKDIQTRMMLDQNARPANSGTVQDQIPAAPQASNNAPAGSPLAMMNPQMQDQPTPIVRPVDKSRKVTYKGRDGQSQDYELLTPEEQTAKAVAKATSMKHAGSTLIQTPDHLRKLGMPAEMYVPDEHLYQYAETTGQLAPIDTPQSYQEMGGPAQVPLRALPSVTSTMNSVANRKSADTRNAATNATREKVAAGNQAAANTRAADANATRLKAAAGRNATTLEAAGIRRDSPTPGQRGVADRFKQRQLDADQKELNRLDAQEAALHAQKVEVGQMNPGPKDNSADFVKQREAKLKGLDIRIGGIAESKKKIAAKYQGGMPQQTQAGGQIRVQLSDGQTGTIDASEFDEKTMKKLE